MARSINAGAPLKESLLASPGDCQAYTTQLDALKKDLTRIFVTKDLKEQVGVINARYGEGAVFVDPLMKVKGLRDVKLEFYSLIKLFSDISYVPQSTTVEEGKNSSGANVLKVVVGNDQSYQLARSSWISRKLLPEEVELQVDTKLEVEPASWRVLKHEEVWKNKKVPVPGFFKPVNGWSLALMFRMFGWQKDIKNAEKQPTSQS